MKEDWPNIYKIKYAMADLLYFQKDWAKCGPAFDSVVAENPHGARGRRGRVRRRCSATRTSTTRRTRAAPTRRARQPARSEGRRRRRTRRPRRGESGEAQAEGRSPSNQKGMVTAFNRYICYIKPAAERQGGARSSYVEVKYARARTYFEAQHWEEAAIGFRDIAHEPRRPRRRHLRRAALPRGVNVLGSNVEPPRPRASTTWRRTFRSSSSSTARATRREDNAEQCELLTRSRSTSCASRRRRWSSGRTRRAARAATRRSRDYEKGGDAYLEMWRKYCEDPLSRRQAPQCEKCDEIALQRGAAFQAARLVAKAITARVILPRPEVRAEQDRARQEGDLRDRR